jgi:hypothetical protein
VEAAKIDPFGDTTLGTNYFAILRYKQIFDVADSEGTRSGTFYRFPEGTIGAIIWHRNSGNDSIQFYLENLYQTDTGGVAEIDYWANTALTAQAANDSLYLMNLPLAGAGLDIARMPYGDTLDTLFMTLYVSKAAWVREMKKYWLMED